VPRADAATRIGDLAGARADYELVGRAGLPESRAAGVLGLAELARLEGDLDTARRWRRRPRRNARPARSATKTSGRGR